MDIALVNRMVGIVRGGGEIWDLKMAEGLKDRGVDVTFYIGKPLRSDLSKPIKGFETVEIPTPHLRDLAYAAPPGVGGALAHLDSRIFCRRVVKEIQRRDHDLVQICSRPHFAHYVDRIDAPVSIVMHGEPYSLWYDVLKPWGSAYDLLEEFDQVIAVEGATQAIEKHSSCNVKTINPGVDTGQFSPGDYNPTNSKRLLFVGRFVPAKNLKLLVEAFDNVIDEHPDAELVLVGEGPCRERIKRAVDQRDLDSHVEFRGYVPNADLPAMYRSSCAFVLSSKSESFGMTLLEAMSCGVPVVAPRIGVIPDIVEDERTGLLYTANSASDLIAAINRILCSSGLHNSFSRRARERAVDKFDWRNRHDILFKTYKELIKNNKKKLSGDSTR